MTKKKHWYRSLMDSVPKRKYFRTDNEWNWDPAQFVSDVHWQLMAIACLIGYCSPNNTRIAPYWMTFHSNMPIQMPTLYLIWIKSSNKNVQQNQMDILTDFIKNIIIITTSKWYILQSKRLFSHKIEAATSQENL